MSREQGNGYKRRTVYGVDNNAALKPDYRGTAVPKREEHQRAPRRKAQRKPRVSAPKTVIMMMTVACMMGLIISRYAVISANTVKIHKLQQEIQQTKDANAHLEIELAAFNGAASIRNHKAQELGMDYPTAEQVRTISLANTTGEATEASAPTNWYDKVLDVISNVLGRILN